MTADDTMPVANANRHLLLIYTGGTIGAEYDAKKGHYAVQPSPEPLIRRVREAHPKISALTELQSITPMMVMSEDIIPADWEDLADHIERQINFHQKQKEPLDGVVVTHGTDTLPYTASALSFLLQNTPVPIVLTGASLPPDQEGSDATDNLWHSLLTASLSPYAGVFVVFRSKNGENGEIHLGTRVRQMLPFEKHFESIANAIVGTVDQKPKFYASLNQETTPLREERAGYGELTSEIALERGVFYFRIHPGFDPTLIADCLDKKPKGLILELYHSGTLCHRRDSRYDLIPAIAEARERGVYVFFTHLPSGDSSRQAQEYQTSFLLEKKLGAIPVRDMTVEAILPKVMWVLRHASTEDEIKTLMARNLVGEICPRASNTG